MIRFQLRCGSGHEFDGWFRTGADFESQAEKLLIECPYCGTTRVEKALMAPALGRFQGQAAAATPESMTHAFLRQLRMYVETQCDNVGERFADEAIARRNLVDDGEELPARGIYGTVNDEGRERLSDEGIDYVALPWVKRSDA